MDAVLSDGIERAPERRSARQPIGVRRNERQMDLAFVAPVLATPTRALLGMVRGSGGGSSIESQRAAVDTLSMSERIRRRIMEILATEGPLNDRELEARVEFRCYAPSTVRKRRSELYADGRGRIMKVGRRDKMAIWDVSPTERRRVERAR